MKKGVGIGVGTFIGLAGYVGYKLTNKVYKPKCWEITACYESEIEVGMINREAFESLEKEEVEILSPHGGIIRGFYFPIGGAKDTVIIAHGYGYTRYGSVKYMKVFQEAGFNVLIYDQRGHGLSDKTICTMGHREKDDLKCWVDWVESRNGKEGKIGTLGVSMGGATVLLHGAIDERVAFVIADCPYASLTEQLTHVVKQQTKLPIFPLIPLASLVSKIRIGAFFGEIAPIKYVDVIKAPVLFIHGTSDTYIPPSASEKMYDKRQGKKYLHLIEGAEHAACYQVNAKEYEEEVKKFLKVICE